MLSLIPGSNTTELNLAWYSGTGSVKSFVSLFDECGYVKTASGTSGAASTGKQWHKAKLTGLIPGKKYRYSVSNDSANWSGEYDYSSPAAGAFKFAIVGDPQISAKDGGKTESTWPKTVGKILAEDVNFIVSAGDQVDSVRSDGTGGGDESEYAIFFAPAALRNIPLAPVMGNHDPHNFFGFHFNLPNEHNTSSSFSSYYYRYNYFYLYNNILFIALNTGVYPDNTTTRPQQMVENFDKVIVAAKDANAGKYDWIVVQHHKSTKSISLHAADADVVCYSQAGFEDLMAKHGIDLVIAGHDHIYARTKPLKGTVYLTLLPSSDTKMYPPVDSLVGSHIAKHYPPLKSYNFKYGYMIADVSGKRIELKTYGTDGTSIDEFSLSK
jgi:hypothetical protein